MFMGNLDTKVSKMLERKEKRLKRQATFINNSKSKKHCPTLATVPEELECQIAEPFDKQVDPDFQLPKHSRLQQHRSAPNARQDCRQIFSFRQSCCSPCYSCPRGQESCYTPLVIDEHKVRRDSIKVRKQTQEKSSKISPTLGLYFDGTTHSTIKHEEKVDTYHKVTCSEEHISLVQEPGGQYLGHLTSGKSADPSAASILKFCEQKEIN
ncbi:NADH-quinone oxidoreductase subunit B [Frankliniella fusca]|uniref:NADH-quinone oxidoreductase subunit B n=1 Tax=Frankliniella fusca TaxID=407009 RepID=A0AAE1HVH7_9NEOP|nr:NADH-quinone oxidoreductase subunit B [Frankliniella fusca]